MYFPSVLVLGATGRIGGILRRVWPGIWPETSLPDQVLWQARKPVSEPEPGYCETVFDPLGDPGALIRAATGRAAILCLSGVTPARAARSPDPQAALAHNIALGEAAVRAGAACGARVFVASSAAVYGDRPGLLEETAPLAPVSPYGRAKAETEVRAAALGAKLGVPVCALRIANVAGLDAILGGWRPGFELDQFPGGRTPARSYIGPATLARVLGELLMAPDLPGALNIAAPGVVEMGALLEAAGLGWHPRPARPGAIARVALSTTALERFTVLSPADGRAATLVAEWRDMTGGAG